MLAIKQKRGNKIGTIIMSFFAVGLIGGGLYVLSLVVAPSFPQLVSKPISAASLPEPKVGTNRIIIPKIGVNIPYGSDGVKALDAGAWWRYPERGDPEKGGNFIIAAHRFSIQPTIGQTIVKSPFYNIDKLGKGDQILIDYNGKRYLYTASDFKNVKPDQVEIEAPSDTAKLTLYSCDLGGSAEGRVVIVATPSGQVDTAKSAT